MSERYLTFLTDFGDAAPATCRGVIWSILPDARINDLTHGSRQFGIRDAAVLLWSSLPYQPIGVHLAVVDPGVGTERRAIAIEVGRGDRLVGPDNGLFMPAADRLGGIVAAHELTNQALWRGSVSSTFHGRDLFAPVAAHLAAGLPIAEVGDPIAPDALVALAFPSPSVSDGGLDTSVLFVDTFGNARLAGDASDLAQLRGTLAPGDQFTLRIGARMIAVPWQDTFGAVPAGELLLYQDADYAGLALAMNQGSAAAELALAADKPVRIVPA
jgi:S-adenosylmethionine hydrolase